jgi:diacylglycerol kinase (ATP)
VKVTVVTNPRAGRCTGITVAASAADFLREAGWDVDVQVTSAAGDGQRLARDAADAGAELVVGVGGDGTLSELLNGLMASNIPCGMIPCGTGNDFARFVGIKENAVAAAKQLLTGEPVAIDMGRLTGPQRYFVNTIGVGFDAAVAGRINRRKRLTQGLLAYGPAIISELAIGHFLAATVEVDEQVFAGEWLLVAVANGNAYGAGFKIAPNAVCDDGLLDVVLVERMGRLAVLRSLRQAYRGRHQHHPHVTMLRGRHISIKTEAPAPALVDGDLLADTPLEIEIVPNAGLLWK